MILQGLVHSLMTAVLLRMAWFNTLRVNTKANPPIAQSAKPAKATRSKWSAVICANHFRKAVLTENPLKTHPGQLIAHMIRMATAKKIAT